MNPERWQQIKKLLDEAIAVSPLERASHLDRACAGDAELRREVASLLRSHEEAGAGFLETPAFDLKAPPPSAAWRVGSRVGAYRIVSEIGAGGMGEVYRAARDDGQYTKEVAVKLVRGGLDSQSVLRRFLNERQILASLDHPNIARLLDGGTTDDGIPYLVMELIEGQPIDLYCDEHRLSIPERLDLFRQVCVAVHYAHQRLVIHRDIKPSNVLVTKDGIPKLLDFGIAKIIEPSQEAQTTVAHAMTPEFASPEQIRGETITTASDVYSLGVLLYQLLTGRSPYSVHTRTPHVMAKAVCESEPGRPSAGIAKQGLSAQATECASLRREASAAKLSRRMAGDLDEITMMALRKEPSRRYGSAEQFGEDIRRHLEGLPVAASKGSWNYRARKFLQRHRLGMTAAALVMLAILAGGAATLREARIAQANADRAQRRFDDVRRLANSLLFEINDSIEPLPGSIPARKLLVDRALQYLDSLASESGSEVSLQRELATAYKRVGDVQGYPFLANLGDTKGALKSYQKAQAIETGLYQANPDNLEDALTLAVVERRLCEVNSEIQNITNSLSECNHAVEIGERLSAKYPQEKRAQLELAKDYQTLAGIEGGNMSANMGNTLGALQLHQKVLPIAEKLAAADPGDRVQQRFLASALLRLGDQLVETGNLSQAQAQYLRGLQVLRVLASPNNAISQEDLGDAYSDLGSVQSARGDDQGAEASFQMAWQIFQGLSQADPQNVHLRTSLLFGSLNLAGAESILGKTQAAADSFRKAQAIGDQLAKANPTAEVRSYLALGLVTRGDAASRTGQAAAALRDYREAVDLYSKLCADDPGNSDSRLSLAAADDEVGERLVLQGDAAGATDAFQNALKLAAWVKQDHANAQLLYVIADSNTGLGNAMSLRASHSMESHDSRQQHWRAAQSFYEESLKTWHEVPEPGLVSFDGFRSTPPSVVEQRLAACKRKLADKGK